MIWMFLMNPEDYSVFAKNSPPRGAEAQSVSDATANSHSHWEGYNAEALFELKDWSVIDF
jgi:hypothetical protein